LHEIDSPRQLPGWSPYLSLEDAQKLDDVQEALRRHDLRAAERLARIFTLSPAMA